MVRNGMSGLRVLRSRTATTGTRTGMTLSTSTRRITTAATSVASNARRAPIASICVYCGSNSGTDPLYLSQANELGKRIAGANIRLVYGGGRVGLMGAVADAVLGGGGHVTGVIPRSLVAAEIAHTGLTELEIVDSMHARKLRMITHADAFVALPGGFGTAEEIFEVLTWKQLGLPDTRAWTHAVAAPVSTRVKPCAFLNTSGFYDSIQSQITRMVQSGFVRPETGSDVWFGSDIDRMMEWFMSYTPPHVPDKWIRK